METYTSAADNMRRQKLDRSHDNPRFVWDGENLLSWDVNQYTYIPGRMVGVVSERH